MAVSVVTDMYTTQCNSYNFSVGPLEVVDELTNQPKELLRVLTRRFSEFNLDKGKTGLGAWKSKTSV